MELLTALNPATGTSLPLPLLVVLGVVIIACVVLGIVTRNAKKKNGKDKRD